MRSNQQIDHADFFFQRMDVDRPQEKAKNQKNQKTDEGKNMANRIINSPQCPAVI